MGLYLFKESFHPLDVSGLALLMEKSSAEGKLFFAYSIGEKTKMADSYQAFRQDMEGKTAKKFDPRQSKNAVLTAIGIVLPAKRNLAIVHLHKPVVGNGHPMRVAGEVLEDTVWTSKGGPAIDKPVLLIKRGEIGSEGLGILEVLHFPKEGELTPLESLLQRMKEFASEKP